MILKAIFLYYITKLGYELLHNMLLNVMNSFVSNT